MNQQQNNYNSNNYQYENNSNYNYQRDNQRFEDQNMNNNQQQYQNNNSQYNTNNNNNYNNNYNNNNYNNNQNMQYNNPNQGGNHIQQNHNNQQRYSQQNNSNGSNSNQGNMSNQRQYQAPNQNINSNNSRNTPQRQNNNNPNQHPQQQQRSYSNISTNNTTPQHSQPQNNEVLNQQKRYQQQQQYNQNQNQQNQNQQYIQNNNNLNPQQQQQVVNQPIGTPRRSQQNTPQHNSQNQQINQNYQQTRIKSPNHVMPQDQQNYQQRNKYQTPVEANKLTQQSPAYRQNLAASNISLDSNRQQQHQQSKINKLYIRDDIDYYYIEFESYRNVGMEEFLQGVPNSTKKIQNSIEFKLKHEKIPDLYFEYQNKKLKVTAKKRQGLNPYTLASWISKRIKKLQQFYFYLYKDIHTDNDAQFPFSFQNFQWYMTPIYCDFTTKFKMFEGQERVFFRLSYITSCDNFTDSCFPLGVNISKNAQNIDISKHDLKFDYKLIASTSINSMGISGSEWNKRIHSEFIPLLIVNRLLQKNQITTTKFKSTPQIDLSLKRISKYMNLIPNNSSFVLCIGKYDVLLDQEITKQPQMNYNYYSFITIQMMQQNTNSNCIQMLESLMFRKNHPLIYSKNQQLNQKYTEQMGNREICSQFHNQLWNFKKLCNYKIIIELQLNYIIILEFWKCKIIMELQNNYGIKKIHEFPQIS